MPRETRMAAPVSFIRWFGGVPRLVFRELRNRMGVRFVKCLAELFNGNRRGQALKRFFFQKDDKMA